MSKTKNQYHLEYWRAFRERDLKGAWWSYIAGSIRTRAKNQGVKYSLDGRKPLESLPDVCPVLGLTLDYNWGTRGKGGRLPNSPSIDRIIVGGPYSYENIRVISWRANDLLSNGTLEEFEKLVRFLKR